MTVVSLQGVMGKFFLIKTEGNKTTSSDYDHFGKYEFYLMT